MSRLLDCQFNMHQGTRFSLADAFLNQEVLQRDNLYVKINAEVKRVIFEEDRSENNVPKAIGVEVYFKETQQTRIIYSQKEVIFSA